MNNARRPYGLLAVAVILLGMGAALLLYPRWTAWQYSRQVTEQKTRFDDEIDASARDADDPLERLYRDLQNRNQTLYETSQADLRDPFSYEEPGISLAEYGLQDDIIGFVQIPALDLELPIVLGANEEHLKQGAAHLTQTSYPIGGENTNCVLAAHRGYYKAPMLREVERLQIGDTVYVQNFRETLTYTVDELRIIDPSDVEALLIQPGRDLLTLVTCHPLGGNSQRYVVYCVRSSPEEDNATE